MITLTGMLLLNFAAFFRRFSFGPKQYHFNWLPRSFLLVAVALTYARYVSETLASLSSLVVGLIAASAALIGLFLLFIANRGSSAVQLPPFQASLRILLVSLSVGMSLWGLLSPSSFSSSWGIGDVDVHAKSVLFVYCFLNLVVNAFMLDTNDGKAIGDSCVACTISWSVLLFRHPHLLKFSAAMPLLNAFMWLPTFAFSAYVFYKL